MLFLQFAYSLTSAMLEAEDRKVSMGMGVKMVSDQEIQQTLVDRE